MGTAIKHPVPDRVEPSFVIFDIRALCRSGLSVRVSGLLLWWCEIGRSQGSCDGRQDSKQGPRGWSH